MLCTASGIARNWFEVVKQWPNFSFLFVQVYKTGNILYFTWRILLSDQTFFPYGWPHTWVCWPDVFNNINTAGQQGHQDIGSTTWGTQESLSSRALHSPHRQHVGLQSFGATIPHPTCWPQANKTVDITELASAFNVDPMPLSTIPEKGRKLFEAMSVDIPKWEKSGTLGEDEKNWWIRHLQTMEIFNEPVVAQAKDLPQFRRICPVQEIQLAVGEDLRRHMLSLTQESTVRKIFLVYLLDIILNNISINQFLLH